MQPNIWNDERITAYVMGELSPGDAERLEVEMNSNTVLAAAVQEARDISQQLSSLFAKEPSMSLDADKREAIIASSVTPAVDEQSNATHSRFWYRRVFALAASMLLIGTLGTLVLRVPGVSDATPQVAMLEGNEKQQTRELVTPTPPLLSPAPETFFESEEVAQTPFNPRLQENRRGLTPGEIASSPAAPAMAPASAGMAYDSFAAEPAMDADFGATDLYSSPPAAAPPAASKPFASRRERGLEVASQPLRLEKENFVSPPGAFGRGPGNAGDRFEPIIENGFRRVSEAPLSTFSIDVDTASYSKVRQFIMQNGTLPPAGAVRIEEMINYFDYQYEPPAKSSEHPFVARAEVANCPWNPAHRLARVAIKGKVIENEGRPASNLVFLVDTSGSMNEPNKLPLLKQGLRKLIEQLGEKDRVAIVVYAGSAGLALDSTPATQRSTILRKLNKMQSGGSTNGGEGIRLAYQVARDHFIDGGVNRVILCSDGDFNVGTTSNDELVELVEKESKGGIDITVLGFGMGNFNDSMMEQISGRGNGNYAFIDTESEANRVLVQQTSSTLVTIARDVKIQVEFNPAEVAAYRLIGYENRALANEDFKDDTKDAGEIGAGHSVTAIYEIILGDGDTAVLPPEIDELRYQKTLEPTKASDSGELMTVKLRYKKPGSDTSVPVEFPVPAKSVGFADASTDFRFASAVAGFGMLLRSSEHIGDWTLRDVESIAADAKGDDEHGYREEFISMVQRAAELRSQESVGR